MQRLNATVIISHGYKSSVRATRWFVCNANYCKIISEGISFVRPLRSSGITAAPDDWLKKRLGTRRRRGKMSRLIFQS
jgi:hypothetical protein